MVGVAVGVFVGVSVGVSVGVCVGVSVGVAVGVSAKLTNCPSSPPAICGDIGFGSAENALAIGSTVIGYVAHSSSIWISKM